MRLPETGISGEFWGRPLTAVGRNELKKLIKKPILCEVPSTFTDEFLFDQVCICSVNISHHKDSILIDWQSRSEQGNRRRENVLLFVLQIAKQINWFWVSC